MPCIGINWTCIETRISEWKYTGRDATGSIHALLGGQPRCFSEGFSRSRDSLFDLCRRCPAIVIAGIQRAFKREHVEDVRFDHRAKLSKLFQWQVDEFGILFDGEGDDLANYFVGIPEWRAVAHQVVRQVGSC